MIYKLPHPLDRPGQQEAYNWLRASDKKYNIICAPTGSGKSAWVAEASRKDRVLVLTETKSLQSANYRDVYNFDILYGKSNYPCMQGELKKRHPLGFTAFDCGNPDCNCPYQQQERHCLSSQRVSLNYAKFLMSKSFVDVHQPDILFLDEGHNLPNIVTNFIGFTIRWDNEFVKMNGNIKPLEPIRLTQAEAMTIFRQVARAVQGNKVKQTKDLPKWRKWKRLKQKVDVTNAILTSSSLDDWYYESDPERFIVKPLTAKYHFKRLFDVAPKLILMSATITPSIIERLGIEDDEYAFYDVPHPWPSACRTVYNLNAPIMRYGCSEEDKDKHASVIAKVLSGSKSGVIHVTSKAQAYELADRLSAKRPDLAFWLPQLGIGTDRQLQEWYAFREVGVYCIAWAFHEGVDLGGDDIIVIAKVPYASLAGNYEQARVEYDQEAYLNETAYRLEQACGRNRRGMGEHYQLGAREVYIADNAWHRLKTRLSSEFVRSIRKWNGKLT